MQAVAPSHYVALAYDVYPPNSSIMPAPDSTATPPQRAHRMITCLQDGSLPP